MQNPLTAGSYYRISTVKVTTEPKVHRKRKSKLPGEPVAIASERTKKGRKRKVTKEQKQEEQRMQQQDQQEREEQERMEQAVQQIAFLQWQLEEQKKQEKARKDREEREFHTHQRRLAQQQRLQDGQHAWKLEWQRQQPHLRELLHTEELFFQAQETLQPNDIPLSDMVHREYLHNFTQGTSQK